MLCAGLGTIVIMSFVIYNNYSVNALDFLYNL